MSTSQLVLLSYSSNGIYTAQWLHRPEIQALGASPALARKRLTKLIMHLVNDEEISILKSYGEGVVFSKIFSVQPCRTIDGRRILVGRPVSVPLRYVRVEDRSGQRSCYIPELNVWTQWSTQGDEPPPELDMAIRFRAAHVTMEKLQRWWPPLFSEVIKVTIQARESKVSHSEPKHAILESIAEPIRRKMVPFLPPDVRATLPIQALREFMQAGGGIVVGESGCGKSSLIAGVAVELEAERKLERKKSLPLSPQKPSPMFWRTSVHRLISGMQYLGQWQERVEKLIDALMNIDGILVLDNLRDLVRYGGTSPRDSIAAFMVPFIRSGRLKVVIESSPSELDAVQQLVPGLVEALPIIRLKPWSLDSEKMLLQRLMEHRLRETEVTIEPEIAATIQRLCRQFQSASSPPSGTVRFTEKVVDEVGKQDPGAQLSVTETVTQFSRLYGLPEVLLRDDLPLNRTEIVASLMQEVIGQRRACETVASVFSRIKTSLNDPQRPFANLFFCGPTGVGKTQLAKALAKALFGYQQHKTPLVRVDMSEYSFPGAGLMFLQNSKGESAAWLQQIRNRPLSVLLLDEIEKASPDVFDVLLSLLDEGRLTDRYGLTTSFLSCVVIMTSNVGVRRGSSLGFGDILDVDYSQEVRRAFRPEFFNRLDHVIPFAPLSYDGIIAIAAKELTELGEREGLRQRAVRLNWTDRILESVARTGFHPELGARPLQKAIELNVVAPLSRYLIDHPECRDCRMLLDLEEDRFVIVTE